MKRYRFVLEDLKTGIKHEMKYSPEGWDSFGVCFGRETDISSVVKSYTDGWGFWKEDAEWVKGLFYEYGVNRRIRMTIDEMEDVMRGKWRTVYRGYLDLTQTEVTTDVVNVPIVEGGLYKALENKWSEEYRYDYNAYCKVEGNVFSERAKFTSPDSISGNTVYGYTGQSAYILTGGVIVNSDDISDDFFQTTSVQLVYETQSNAMLYYDPTVLNVGNAHLRVQERVVPRLSVKWGIEMEMYTRGLSMDSSCRYLVSTANLYVVSMRMEEDGRRLLKYGAGQKWTRIGSVETRSTVSDNGVLGEAICKICPKMAGEVTLNDYVCSDEEGEEYGVFIVLELTYGKQITSDGETEIYGLATAYPNGYYNIRFSTYSLEMEYDMVINRKMISVMRSVDVFRNLIESINDGENNVEIDTRSFEEVAGGDLLTSGEGMKWNLKIEGPRRRYSVVGQIETSLSDFLAYASSVYNYQLGVDYDMEEDRYRVYLAHHDTMYGVEEIGRIGKVGSLTMNVWRDVLYTKIGVGHDAGEDVINIEREFNCKMEFGTPNTEIEESVKEWISPYIGSTRRMETELFREYKTDSDSNADIFLIAGVRAGEHTDGLPLWGIDRSISVDGGSDFPENEWNVKFSPKRMLIAHKRELESYFSFDAGNEMGFKGGDHNEDFEAGGIKEKGNVKIGKDGIFRPLTMDVKFEGSSEWIRKIEANRTGYVSFKYGGKEYRGYLSRGTDAVSIQPLREQESEMKLLVASGSEYRL